jgi:hypothetical protein
MEDSMKAEVERILRNFHTEPELRAQTAKWGLAEFDYAASCAANLIPKFIDAPLVNEALARLREERRQIISDTARSSEISLIHETLEKTNREQREYIAKAATDQSKRDRASNQYQLLMVLLGVAAAGVFQIIFYFCTK